MPFTQPPVALQNPCTIIYDQKVYAYQANAFQCLDLKEGGTWSKLEMGVSVNGSTCVQGTVDGKPAFIVVGGTTSTQNYQGMQHYDLSSSKWTSDRPADGVAINRQYHGTAFLQQSSAILMYAGSQDNQYMPSTQTFLIHTTSPYNVEAFESSAPPVINPLMLSYNTTHALMLGGDESNTRLSLFDPAGGWRDLNVNLTSGLKDISKVQASLLSGSEGGQILEIFDLSVSPNQVSTVLLHNATSSGKPSRLARSYRQTPHHPAKRRKRDVTLANLPPYNNTLAPRQARTGFSLATDSKTGLVAATGGDTQEPLAIFNQTSNQWVDPNGFFGVEPSPTPPTPTRPAPSSSVTSVLPATATSAPPAANQHVRHRSLTILGGVLGGVLGAAILLVLILVLLRCYRRRRERSRERQKAEYDMDSKPDPLDFSDIGATYMKEAGGSMAKSPDPAHKRNKSDNKSPDPQNIDRNLTASSESKRALLHVKGDSAGSGQSFWSRGKKSPEKTAPQISAPILGPPFARPLMSPEPRVKQREESGWSRYFANNASREMVSAIPQPQQAQIVDPRPETYFSNSQTQSDYESSRITSSQNHESAEVAPLSFHDPLPPPSNAGITSPNNSRPGLGLALTHGPSPERDRDPDSPTSSVSNLSDGNDNHHYSHGDSEAHDSWSPIGASGERTSNWTDERTSSSVHSSRLYAHPGERVVIPNFPMPNSARNSAAPSPKIRSPATERSDPYSQQSTNVSSTTPGLRNVITRDLVRTKSGRVQQATDDIRTGTQRVQPRLAGDINARTGGVDGSSVGPYPSSSQQQYISTGPGRNPDQDPPYRTFPRPPEQLGARGRGTEQTEDMSWLNLGTSAEHGPSALYFPR